MGGVEDFGFPASVAEPVPFAPDGVPGLTSRALVVGTFDDDG